jgi:hypothetical protein
VRDEYDSYQWYRDNQPIPGETKQSITLTKTGVYYVVVRSNKGCTNVSEPIGIGVPVGLQNVAHKPIFTVYPNPSRGMIYVERGIVTVGKANIVITDLAGRVVYTGEMIDDFKTINLDLIATGTYYIRIEQNDVVTTKPIVIIN